MAINENDASRAERRQTNNMLMISIDLKGYTSFDNEMSCLTKQITEIR